MAANMVFKTIHPESRIAPVRVRLPPQFIGVRSTYSWPFFTQAWVRVIERFSPDSSIKTSLPAGTCFIACQYA